MSVEPQVTDGIFSDPTMGAMVVFGAVFFAVLAIGWWVFFTGRGTSHAALPLDAVAPTASESGLSKRSEALLNADFKIRRGLAAVFKGLSILIIGVLATLTVISYFYSTPGTGDILVTIVLAAVTLIVTMHLLGRVSLYDSAPDPRLLTEAGRPTETRLSHMLGEALSGRVTVNWEVAAPEVHKMDLDDLARARVMVSQGKSIDDVCLAVNKDYAGWSPPHQQAFRAVIEAAVNQG